MGVPFLLSPFGGFRLIEGPLQMYVLGFLLKVLWVFERRTHCIITFIVLIVFDQIIPVREWLFYLFGSSMFYGLTTYRTWQVITNPLSMMPSVLVDPTVLGLGFNHHFGWKEVTIHLPIYGRVFLWIWLSLVTLLTWLMYEPVWSYKLRKACFRWVRRKTWRRPDEESCCPPFIMCGTEINI